MPDAASSPDSHQAASSMGAMRALDEPWARSVLEENPEIIGMFRSIRDEGGRFTDAEIVTVNRAGRDRWFDGRAEAEIAGRHLFRDWPHLRPFIFDLYREAVEQDHRIRREQRVRWGDIDVWVEVTVHPFPGGFTHLSRDVTEARRAAIAHAAAEERFRIALDHATETMAVYRPLLDADGRLDDLEIVFINRIGRERWLGGATASETIGQRLYARWPALRPLTYALYSGVVESGVPFTGIWTAPADHGRRRYEARIAAFPGGLIQTSMDVTDREVAGEELQALAETLEQRVQERTSDLEAFTRTASHDLRAPIRAINGFATIVRRRYGDLLDDGGRHYLDNIVESSLAMGNLLEDLLGYARLGGGGIRAVPVDLGDVLESTIRARRDLLRANHASLTIRRPMARPVGDPSLIESILANLVTNACTYHRPGLPPVIRIASVHVGDAVEVSVEDEGIGIPADQTEAIFEVFTRLHSPEEYPGTGIGLSIVRRAARLMGTDVTVESEPGRGTTFRLRLPAADPAPSDRPS